MWCLFSSLGTSSRSGRCVVMGVVRRILLGVGLVFGMVRYSVGSWDRRSGLDVVRYRDSSGSWSVGMEYGRGLFSDCYVLGIVWCIVWKRVVA